MTQKRMKVYELKFLKLRIYQHGLFHQTLVYFVLLNLNLFLHLASEFFVFVLQLTKQVALLQFKFIKKQGSSLHFLLRIQSSLIAREWLVLPKVSFLKILTNPILSVNCLPTPRDSQCILHHFL